MKTTVLPKRRTQQLKLNSRRLCVYVKAKKGRILKRKTRVNWERKLLWFAIGPQNL